MAAKRAPSSAKSKRPSKPGPGSPALGQQLIEWGVLAGSVLVPAALLDMGNSPFGPPKLLTLMVATTLVLAGLWLDGASRERLINVVRTSRLAWCAAALIALMALAVTTSVDPRQAFLGTYPDYRGLVTLLACLAIGCGAVVVAIEQLSLRRYLRRFVAVCVWVIGVGVLQRMGALPVGPEGLFREGSRIATTLGNSSNYGVFLVIAIPVLVAEAITDESKPWRIIAGSCAAFGVLSVMWTLSRGAWVAALAVVLVGAILAVRVARERQLGRGALVGITLLLILAAIGAALTPGFGERASILVDAGSRTAHWRISAWRSAGNMTLARPFLGYGPNTFRLVYPPFQEKGQVGGAKGYRTIESAHNLMLDTATSGGMPALLALLGLCAAVSAAVVRLVSRKKKADGVVQGAAVGLVGGFVAVQFHYVTMDTGPLFATLLAVIATAESQSRSQAAQTLTRPAVRHAIGLVTLFYAVATVASVGLMVADITAAEAGAATKEGASWSRIHSKFADAAALAPWELQLRREEGSAAALRIASGGFDAEVTRDGLIAFDDVVSASPLDTSAATERANFLLAAGVAAKDDRLLVRAEEAFRAVIARDPNTGIPRAGRAAALLALGQTDQAIQGFEEAVSLSPKDRTAWRNLALAYQRAGRQEDAARARSRGKK